MADVQLRKLVKRYDEVEAVRGIDLDIADHELVLEQQKEAGDQVLDEALRAE